MEKIKTWWEKKGWIAVVGVAILLFLIVIAVGEWNTPSTAPSNAPSTATTNTDAIQPATAQQGAAQAPEQNANPAAAPQSSAPQAAPAQSANQADNSDAQTPPRNPDGTIVQLKITATAYPERIDFSSQENYTNCTENLAVISVEGNNIADFTTTTYTDNYFADFNLFAGDQHSVAYGSLTDNNGDTLSADINSGMYGSNNAGTWELTCDQGQYALVINTL